MKKLFILSIMVCICVNVTFAQWNSDPAVNTVISVPGERSQTLVKAKRTSDGKFFVSWLKWEEGMNGYIKLQLLDKDGNPLWEQGGIYVSKHVTATWTSDYSLDVTPDGCAVIAHSDSRTDPNERHDFKPYAYKIDQEGNFLWGLDGVAIPCEGNHGHRPRIGVTKSGNVIVGYSNTDNGSFEMQKVNADGTLGWSQNIQLPGMMGNFVSCEEDDFILVWYSGGITAQRFDSYGDAVWGEPVVIEDREFNGRVEPNLVSDGKDGFVISYQRYVSLSEFYSCLQRVTAEGEKTMGLQSIDTSDQIAKHSGAGIGVNPEKEQIIAFWDMNNGEYAHLEVNKFNYNGECLWQESGIELDSKVMWGYASGEGTVLPDESSIIVYGDYQASIDLNLTVHKLDKEGNTVWKKTLGETCFMGEPHSIFTEDAAYIFWNDDREEASASGDGTVYGQNITYEGEFGVSSIKSQQFNADNSIYYDAANKLLNINMFENASVSLYNICGTLIEIVSLSAGENVVPVNLTAGVYLVKSVVNGENICKKIIIK